MMAHLLLSICFTLLSITSLCLVIAGRYRPDDILDLMEDESRLREKTAGEIECVFNVIRAMAVQADILIEALDERVRKLENTGDLPL